MDDEKALQGLRVLDLSRVLSGPYATMCLADMGADVVKVERPGKGDDTRSFGPPFVDGVSTYFLSINRGKRSICLDLKSPVDRETLKELAARADVLVENFRPGVMKRLGLSYAELSELNPGLVYCSISGFGQDKEGPGYDLMVQGLSGIPSVTGDGAIPTKCGASIADLVAGMNAVQGILAALIRRGRSGAGALVDVPMLDGQLSLLTYHASAWLNGGVTPRAIGNAHPSIHPFCAYRTQDGHLNLALGNDKLFSEFCALLHLDWDQDERFATNEKRVENRDVLDALMIPLMAGRSTEAWLECLAEKAIPAGPLLTVPDALKNAALLSHPHPTTGQAVHSVALPYSIGDASRGSERPAPELGAHRQEVLDAWFSETE